MNSTAQYISSTDIAVTLRGEATDRRQPVHLIFLIDTSDSMSDSGKLSSVKQSLTFIQPLLTSDDLVSMISFGDTSTILLNKASSTDKETLLYKIQSLRTDGCTNLSAGLMNVRDVLLPPEDTRKQGVLLLTDGHANRGITQTSQLKSIVQTLLEAYPELTLTTVGYGNDHNASLLQEMGTTGSGSYNVVYSLENVATVFGEVLGGLTTVVAQNVCVYLPPGSVPKTAYATQKDAEGNVLIRVGDIYAENEIVVFASVPSGTPNIQVSCHTMISFATVNETLELQPPSNTLPKAIEQASFRYRVSEILKKTNDSSIKEEVENLLVTLKELPYASEQLIQMMIDDLERVLEVFAIPFVNSTTATNFAQHSAFLGLGRGLRSQMPEEDDDMYNVHDPQALSSTRSAVVDATFSPFSNRRQRLVTRTLRATTSQMM